MKENIHSHNQADAKSLFKRVVFNEYFIYLVIFIIGCAYAGGAFDPKPAPEDKVKIVDLNGSVETEVSVAHLNSDYDLLTTTHKIWAHGSLAHTYVTTDTLPSLGITNTTAEDAQGNSSNVSVPRDYEIYITVK